MNISRGIEFESGHGGTIIFNQEADNISECGVLGGYAYFEDTYINSKNELLIDVSSGETKVTVKDEYETEVVSFRLTSTVSRGIADFKFENLDPNTWYRLYFDDELGETKSGTAHGKTNIDSEVEFTNVVVPNK